MASVVMYYCPYCSKAIEKLVCPSCHNALMQRKGYYTSVSYTKSPNYHANAQMERDARAACSHKLQEEAQKRAQKTASEAAAFLEKALQPVQQASGISVYNAETISSDQTALLNFLRALLQAECRIYALGRVYSAVCEKLRIAAEIREFDLSIAKKTIGDADEKKHEKASQPPPKPTPELIKRLTDERLEAEGVAFPTRPVKPVLKAKPVEVPPLPTEPVYEKPGIFNKKRVEAENTKKANAYRDQLSAYHRLKTLSERYEKESRRYEKEMEQYRANESAYDQAAADYERRRGEVESAIKEQLWQERTAWEEKQAAVQAEAESQAKDASKEIARLAAAAVESFPNQKKLAFLKVQKKTLEALIQEVSVARNALLNTGLLYQKYQTLVAEACILEYLESGRCEGFTGESGAYNLYESEIRAGIINPILDQLLLSLETFKLSQTVLYRTLNAISEATKDALDKLDKATATMKTKVSNVALTKAWIAARDNCVPFEAEIPATEDAKQKAFVDTLEKWNRTEQATSAALEAVLPRNA